ncbi:MoaD/ThiS family protein [Arhodomonas sp. SL1]|uniref:MoaD/ThiS family protein n=1 Tax=Arhodomonas sp. SL1 TaxID=3425691 RepID=UPI003F884E18
MEVELHGVLRETVGRERLAIDMPPGSRVTEVLDRLEAEVPSLGPHLPRVACAVEDALVPRATVLQGGETLVLLPPVSGG